MQTVGLHEGCTRGQVGKHEVNLACHEIGQGLGGAFVGYMQHVGAGYDAQNGATHNTGTVTRCIGELAGILAGVLDQILDGFVGPIRIADQNERQVAAPGNGREIFHGIVAHVLHEPGCRRMRCVGGDKQGVAIGLGFGHIVGSNGGIGPRFVFNDDGLTQFFAEPIGKNAADGIGTRTGRERHDQGNGFFRIGGNRATCSERQTNQQGTQRALCCFHKVSLCTFLLLRFHTGTRITGSRDPDFLHKGGNK